MLVRKETARRGVPRYITRPSEASSTVMAPTMERVCVTRAPPLGADVETRVRVPVTGGASASTTSSPRAALARDDRPLRARSRGGSGVDARGRRERARHAPLLGRPRDTGAAARAAPGGPCRASRFSARRAGWPTADLERRPLGEPNGAVRERLIDQGSFAASSTIRSRARVGRSTRRPGRTARRRDRLQAVLHRQARGPRQWTRITGDSSGVRLRRRARSTFSREKSSTCKLLPRLRQTDSSGRAAAR